MRKLHQLRELLIGALSFCDGNYVGRWERNLVDGCNVYFGGSDVFESGVDTCAGRFLLFTVFERDTILFVIYYCEAVHLNVENSIERQYFIVGDCLSVKCRFGNPWEIRSEVEKSYKKMEELLGEDDFHRSFGKKVPYAAERDMGLIDIESGVVDCTLKRGTHTEPIVLTLAADSRLRSKYYQDIRQYGDREALENGLFGAWLSLVSSEDRGWEQLSDFIRIAFDRMRSESLL